MEQPFSYSESKNHFIELISVDSTNNYARERIREGMAVHGEAVFAHEQTAGRGRMNKSWYTGKSDNIALSIVIRPHSILISQQFRLIAAVAVAVRDFFENYAVEGTLIKWPNDIYWKDRKAGGILIESIIGSAENGVSGAWQWAIIGIGLNINQTNFSEGLSRAVSMRQITGQSFSTVNLAKELHEAVLNKVDLLGQEGFEAVWAQYNECLFKKGEKVKLKKDSRVFETIISHVSSSGLLVTTSATEEEFAFGEVEWLWD